MLASLCLPGLQAVADVAATIKARLYDIGIGAGLESMTANSIAWEGSINPKVESHRKAAAASASGKFKDETIPTTTKIVDPKTGEEKQVTISVDDEIRPESTVLGLGKLKPVFKKDGITTAGNSSQVSDGARAVLLMRRDVAMRKGLLIVGIFRIFVVVGVDLAIMGIGHAAAIPAVVKSASLQIKRSKGF